MTGRRKNFLHLCASVALWLILFLFGVLRLFNLFDDDDMQLARDVIPGWMGINFRQADAKTRESLHLENGATTVLTVYPDSPAKAAGIEVGDVVLGPPGKPFTEPHQIREWTMLSAIDQPAALDVRRGDEELHLTLVPKPYPTRLPELPGPPKNGRRMR